ncbi:MAG: transcriptional regulator [Gemmatimonadota bacterium]
MERALVKSYGQFCPVAVASEVLTQRWTPLVLRELLCGSTHFNELRKGVPLMSPTLLAQRLRALEEAGVVTREVSEKGRQTAYRLTEAGQELRPIIEGIGVWGRRWLQQELRDEELDPALLMWDMRRRIEAGALPEGRVVVRFEYTDVEEKLSRWWLVLEEGQADVCLADPGFPTDLDVTTTVRLMTEIWMGEVEFRRALGPELVVRGSRALARSLPGWLRLSTFAGVEKSRAAPGGP